MAISLSQAEVVDLGTLPIDGYPFTLAGWFRVPSVTKWLTLMQLENTATNSYHSIIYEGSLAGKAAAVSKVGATGRAKSTISMTPGQWHHVTGVFESDTLRRVYLDGGNMGTSAHLRAFDGLDQFELGNVTTSDGVDVAEAGVFDGVLSNEEIAMLGIGCPMLSLPSAAQLLTYHDCVRGLNRPGVGPVASSAGVFTVVEHPRVMSSSGGLSQLQPFRIHGPYHIDEESSRTSFSEQAQQCVTGIDDGAGQPSVAGITSDGRTHYGEVLN